MVKFNHRYNIHYDEGEMFFVYNGKPLFSTRFVLEFNVTAYRRLLDSTYFCSMKKPPLKVRIKQWFNKIKGGQ